MNEVNPGGGRVGGQRRELKERSLEQDSIPDERQKRDAGFN